MSGGLPEQENKKQQQMNNQTSKQLLVSFTESVGTTSIIHFERKYIYSILRDTALAYQGNQGLEQQSVHCMNYRL